MPVTSYSTTPANNNGSPPDGAPEGWAPSDVNNTIRQIMADIAVEAQKNAVKVLASVAGTNTITGSMSPALAAYSAGMIVVLTPANNNTGATTLNINSLGALDVQKYDGDALVSGDLVAGIPALLVLDTGADDWILLNPQSHTFPNDLLISKASIPSLVLDDTDAGSGLRRIAVKNNGGNFAITGQTDAGINTADALAATWNGTVFSVLNLQATAVQVNGSSILTAAGAADGSVSAPAYSFSADLNTGMWRVGADNLAFSTNGVTRLSMDTNAVYVGNGASNVPMAIPDGVAAPAALVGLAYIYVDSADGDLKVRFGDGTTKTLATDT